MFPKMGKTFPSGNDWKRDRPTYQMAIASALKRELGGSHQAIKTTMRWTGVSERTAKNWLAGSHGPAGQHLIELMRRSEEVCLAVLILSERDNYGLALDIKEIHLKLSKMIAVLEDAQS